MIALATLRANTVALATAQNTISTGLKVASAKDNAAVWAISETMKSDIVGYQAISASLDLTEAMVLVARKGSENVVDLLSEIKTFVINAAGTNVDTEKIQTNIGALQAQIAQIVEAASVNGQNLLINTDSAGGSGSTTVLGGLSRLSDGTLSAIEFPLQKKDLTTRAPTLGRASIRVAGGVLVSPGETAVIATFQNTTSGTFPEGYTFRVYDQAGHPLGNFAYVTQEGETFDEAMQQVVLRFNARSLEVGADLVFRTTDEPGELELDNNSDITVRFNGPRVAQSALDGSQVNGTVGGYLDLLDAIDVTTEFGREFSLSAAERMIDSAIGAASYFGAFQSRLDTQQTFISGLVDTLSSGIGSLVDADMEASAARAQALQTQQQLSRQTLSIANSMPERFLVLFS